MQNYRPQRNQPFSQWQRIVLLSARISQLTLAQHFISPLPNPFLTELDAAYEAVTAEWSLMKLFRIPKNPHNPEESG
jgi:hypothetical protein